MPVFQCRGHALCLRGLILFPAPLKNRVALFQLWWESPCLVLISGLAQATARGGWRTVLAFWHKQSFCTRWFSWAAEVPYCSSVIQSAAVAVKSIDKAERMWKCKHSFWTHTWSLPEHVLAVQSCHQFSEGVLAGETLLEWGSWEMSPALYHLSLSSFHQDLPQDVPLHLHVTYLQK